MTGWGSSPSAEPKSNPTGYRKYGWTWTSGTLSVLAGTSVFALSRLFQHWSRIVDGSDGRIQVRPGLKGVGFGHLYGSFSGLVNPLDDPR
jgi:hypothetical protein